MTIVDLIEAEAPGMGLRESLHFSIGVLNRIERQMTLGCTLILDTQLALMDVNAEFCRKLPIKTRCFIDEPQVISDAALRRITRAELSMDLAMAQPGPKIIVIGSAPMALRRLLQIHRRAPLVETTLIAAANGFASAIALKEQVWESGLPCVVVRGRRGGVKSATGIINAFLKYAADRQIQK